MTKSSAKNNDFWSCLAANALVCPGAGTWIAGDKKNGAIQILMGILGMSLTLVFAIWFIITFVKTGSMPLQFFSLLYALGLGGIALFLISFAWSIFSVRKLCSKKNEPPTLS